MLSFINFLKKTRFNLPSPIVVITDFLIIFWKKSFKEFIKTLRFCNSTVESLPHQGSLQSLLHHVYLEPTKPMFMIHHGCLETLASGSQGSKALFHFPFQTGCFWDKFFTKFAQGSTLHWPFQSKLQFRRLKSDYWSWLQLLL